MPQNYGQLIPADQLNQLVQYLIDSTAKGGQGGSSKGEERRRLAAAEKHLRGSIAGHHTCGTA